MLTKKERKLFLKQFPNLTSTRHRDANKGTFGILGIIGSTLGMTGACILSGSAALKTGCGKVIIGFNQNTLPIQVLETMPELILKKASELIHNTKITSWVIGCGLGTQLEAITIIKKILKYIESGAHVLIDADGLDILSRLNKKPILTENCVITPHPKEAARLLACSVDDIQVNREQSAITLARKFNCWVVLKGYHTVITSTDENIWINTTGNASLATAGTGDVLSGIIGSLMAQKLPIKEAAISGVWLHGKAADNLVLKGIGPIGLTAHELIDQVRIVRNQLTKI